MISDTVYIIMTKPNHKLALILMKLLRSKRKSEFVMKKGNFRE